MKSYDMSHLLLLLFLVGWDSVHGLCTLSKLTTANCDDLEDARYIDTYQLHTLRASSSWATLTPGNFKNLTSLRHLDLSNGSIETIETGSFAKLGSLMSLNLADNQIAHLEAGAFDGLKYLHSLKLGGNKIRQLPSALMTLKELRLLDVSDNPLNCNCASMKLRDALLARGVKISKKTRCVEPVSSKGMPLLKPDTKMTCVFESQDMEMQGDQPVEGSGEAEDDKVLDEDFAGEEKEIEQPVDPVEEETPAPPTSSEAPPSSSDILASLAEASSTEEVSSSTAEGKDETTSELTSEITSSKDLTTETSSEKAEEVDLDEGEAEKKESVTQDSTKPNPEEESVFEGSGESDDDGSGAEGSGMISPVNVPEIDFNDTPDNEPEGVQDSSSAAPSTPASPTTTDAGWWGVWNAIVGGSDETTTTTTTRAPPTTEKTAGEQVREEDFIPATTLPPKGSDEKPIVPKVVKSVDEPNLSSKILDQPASGDNPDDGEIIDGPVDPAQSQESKKGMGSYVVLATLLAILAALIAFAAYKGDFCKKKRKRNDVERGTEMKDMQKSLLDQNAAQPKVQVSNGNTMENVPLMNSTTTPEEPKDNQRSYDITPAPVVTNGANKPGGWTSEDPVKPPRKGYGQEIEAPLNGLNPPMDDIDGPTTLQNGSDDVLTNGDYNGERPPLSPGAQRVKITMGELPESVPKTPILITRIKNGENLVKTP